MFLLGAVGSCIGLGNVWRFPFMTYKYGALNFTFAYLIALIIAGLPMLILELTLGQKMQRGSVGALRGIHPRIAGVGWVASFSGFVLTIFYNILLGMTLYYLIISK